MIVEASRTINLGKQGDNDYTVVKFDVSGWSAYGDGIFSLNHKRSIDCSAYPCVVSYENGSVYWTIKATDTQFAGNGLAQLVYTNEDGVIIHTEIYNTFVAKSLVTTDTPPEPFRPWVDRITGMIETETAQRMADDEDLANAIDEEAGTRAAKDEDLANAIDEEAGTRAANDTTLNNKIEAEAQQRAEEDAELWEAIEHGGGGAVDDVTVNGQSVVVDRVAEIPLASKVDKDGVGQVTKENLDFLSNHSAAVCSLVDKESTTDKGLTISVKDNIIYIDGTCTGGNFIFNLSKPLNADNYFLSVSFNGNIGITCGASKDNTFTKVKAISLGGSDNAAFNVDFDVAFVYLYISNGASFSNAQYAFTFSKVRLTSSNAIRIDGTNGGLYSPVDMWRFSEDVEKIIANVGNSNNRFYGKNVLVCGDSLTAADRWQRKLFEILNMSITKHALGGANIVQIIDGVTISGVTLPALSVQEVTDKQLIILFMGTNNMFDEHGDVGDLYPTNNTVCGQMQYAINRVFDLLDSANNKSCRVAVVTPYCFGESPYNQDAYGLDGIGLAKSIEDVANYNGLPAYNAFKNSGINMFTWSIYGASETDKLHLNNDGYAMLGERITEFVLHI